MHTFLISDKEKKPALAKVEQICSIPFRSTLYPSYFHSFGMTENYIIFVEQAFKLDILKLATAYFRDVNWGSCLKFDKDDIVRKKSSVLCKTVLHSFIKISLTIGFDHHIDTDPSGQ